jgi:putative DNA primase/helicase
MSKRPSSRLLKAVTSGVDDRLDSEAPGSGLELPTINLGDLAANATDGERALLDAGVEIYQYGGTLVRPIVETVTAANGHKTTIARLEAVGIPYLRDLLARHATWRSLSLREKKWVRRDPPKEIAQTILARAGEWKFPTIIGLITTQTMRPDGSMLTEAGFDSSTQLLLVDPPAMPAVSTNPSKTCALAALAKIEDLLVEFPFVDEVSKAVALSALLTPIVRGAFPVAPMHAFDAVMAGSGKSYLADVVASIAIGQLMPVMAAGRSDEELEKRLGAALMAGQPLISIDNVTNDLGGDALCIAIERGSVRMRILGRSEQARIEARGTTFFATGNNIVVIGDTCRRVVTARLDPRVERPELREFKNNPVAKVMDDRGAYVAAALTICRAYLAAGRPQPAKRLASFEGWSDVVRSALIWLGKADPVASMESAAQLDPERIELRTMMDAWREAVGEGMSRRASLAEVVKLADSRIIGENELEFPALFSALQTAAGKKQKADARALGPWFRKNQDRVLGGYSFKVVPYAK